MRDPVQPEQEMGKTEAPAEHERLGPALGPAQQIEQPGKRQQQRVQVKRRQGQCRERAEDQRREARTGSEPVQPATGRGGMRRNAQAPASPLAGLLLPEDAHSLDAARVRLEHLELDAGRVADDLAARRHTIEQGKDQPAQGVHVLPPFLIQKLQAEPALQLLDLDPGIGLEHAVANVGDLRRHDLVVLVLDLADDLLDEILDRGQAVGATVLVDHDRHVHAGVAHL